MGGATLGLVMAGMALGAQAASPSTAALATVACVVGIVAAASDTRLGGFHLPFHSRQVNERWLDQFRPWVYGAGFGWQFGAGLVTYIKTAALYLMIVLAALTASPATALAVGTLFGWCAVWPSSSAGASTARPLSPRSTGASPRPRLALAVVVACELCGRGDLRRRAVALARPGARSPGRCRGAGRPPSPPSHPGSRPDSSP